MNKAMLTSSMILCLLSTLFLMGCKISVKASLELHVHNIDTELDYATIQEAIDANETLDGHTILVDAGTYYENVDVKKSVSLIGEDRDSTIVDGGGSGNVISITQVNNVNIKGFTMQGSGTLPYSGISIDYSSGIHISHNKITNNYDGVSLYSSGNNVFSGNNISSNDNDGVSLYLSSNNVFSGNNISSNDNDGVSLYLSSNNVFSGNNISSNNIDGMYFLFESKDNIIYHNNFNNRYQVESVLVNVWDNGYEGNYWSDYTGVDEKNGPNQDQPGSDGIGDTPYTIDTNNQDNHPLMGTFSDFKVSWKDRTYHVTTICNSTISNFRFETGRETGNKIISFNITGEGDTVGFCRTMIPTELMNYSLIVLVDTKEIEPTQLEHVSNEAYVHLYFTYIHSSHTITIISSRVRKLEIDLSYLNATYHALLDNYSILLGNYSQLQKSYLEHLNNYSILLGNYSQLQKNYGKLNDTYQKHLLDYSKNMHNVRNLMYIFATITAIFLITTIYLSKRAHRITTFERKTLDRF